MNQQLISYYFGGKQGLLDEDGRLRVVIQRACPLERAAEAHRAVQGGHVRGKVVLTLD